MARAKAVSFINYKGGVGKTTTTYHIGCCLAQHHGKKVLLVDIDPQTNLTFLCAPVEKWEDAKKRSGTIASMYQRFLAKKAIDTKRVIWRTPIGIPGGRLPNLDLIPCDVDLLGEDLGGGGLSGTFEGLEGLRQMQHQASLWLRERLFLEKALREVEDNYDYVLIDCPPNIYLMTQNALVASKWYVITAIPDHLSTIGLSILQKKVGRIGDLTGKAQRLAGEAKSRPKVAELGGVIFVKIRIGGSMVTTMHSNMMDRIRSAPMFKGFCFPTYTTELIGYGEAAENSRPVWMHGSANARRAASRHEYERSTEEFLRRF